MRKRKLEFAIVLLLVAVVVGFLYESPEDQESAPPKVEAQASPTPEPLDVEIPKLELSDDAKWLITTAADSYTPRVEVEKAWEPPDNGGAESDGEQE